MAALAVGAAVGALAVSLRTREIHDDYMVSQTDLLLRDRGIQYQRTTNALWGVAGAAAAAAVVLAIVTRWKRGEQPRVTVIPAATDRGVGLTLQWNH